MPIKKHSRYLRQEVLAVEDAQGRVRRVYEQRDTTVPASERPVDTPQVTPQPGSSLSHIAREMYGSEQLWWVVADMNPEIFYPLDYSDGTLVRVAPRSSLATFTRFRPKG